MGFLTAFVMSLGLKAPLPAAPVVVTVSATPAGYVVEKSGKFCVVPVYDAHRAPTVVVVPEDVAHSLFPVTAVCK